MSTDKKLQLEQKLWNIADTLRGKMDADDLKTFTTTEMISVMTIFIGTSKNFHL